MMKTLWKGETKCIFLVRESGRQEGERQRRTDIIADKENVRETEGKKEELDRRGRPLWEEMSGRRNERREK